LLDDIFARSCLVKQELRREKSERRPRRPEFFTVHCGDTECCRPDWSFGAIRGQEDVKKSQRRPRMAEFFDLSSHCGLVLCTKHSRRDCSCRAIRGQTEHFRANAARKCLVCPRIAAWTDSETPPPGFAVPRHSTSSRSNFFTPSRRNISAQMRRANVSSVPALQRSADSETATRISRSARLDQQPIQFFHTFQTEHFRANAARKCLVSPPHCSACCARFHWQPIRFFTSFRQRNSTLSPFRSL